jgi:hypothetical protein
VLENVKNVRYDTYMTSKPLMELLILHILNISLADSTTIIFCCDLLSMSSTIASYYQINVIKGSNFVSKFRVLPYVWIDIRTIE